MENDFVPSRYALMKVAKQIVPASAIQEPMMPVPEGTGYYVTKSGEFYRKYGEDKFVHVNTRIVEQTGGYRYAQLYSKNGKPKTFRAHKLVARAWIPNPECLPIVGHKNNNKADNRVENLYWTTWSENTQKAVGDGLLVNDKGFDDSQSHPVVCFGLDKKPIRTYGSVCEAHRDLGVSKSTVMRQARHEHHTKPRAGYFFRFKDEVDQKGFVL